MRVATARSRVTWRLAPQRSVSSIVAFHQHILCPSFCPSGLSATTWFPSSGRARPFSLGTDGQLDGIPPPLVSLKGSQLKYTSSKSIQLRVDFSIAPASEGGHVLLGVCGSGKSLISNALAEGFQQHRQAIRGDEAARDTPTRTAIELNDDQAWHAQAIAHVSFESHEELINLRDDDGLPLSVQKAIASGGALNKAAQFLVVRFGMFPLLHRSVPTLSTGEIRKVLLIRALANRPRLLVLDNAFDGLDVPSRSSLKDLVSRTLQGFRPDILVQAVDHKATAHTQVLLITHRAEEIVEPITRVTRLTMDGDVVTEDRKEQSGEVLLQQALGLPANDSLLAWGVDSTLPSVEAVRGWWHQEQQEIDGADQLSDLVALDNLQIQRGEAILLDDLNWTVQQGQHWWIAGGNGAGKSTLSRLLARREDGIVQGTLQLQTADSAPLGIGDRRKTVGWVSTESHMTLARSELTAKQVLTQHSPRHDATSVESAITVLEWLELPTSEEFLHRTFGQLSQGEQKIVLIAAAIASRPKLLVLDEPCQGLDWIKRQRALGLVERLCQAAESEMSLIYITHHPEEVIPSIGHVLHLTKGQDVFQGKREKYDADAVAAAAESIEEGA